MSVDAALPEAADEVHLVRMLSTCGPCRPFGGFSAPATETLAAPLMEGTAQEDERHERNRADMAINVDPKITGLTCSKI